MPRAIIIAGPNGAGKSTFASEFLPNEAQCPVFVNADLIAWGLSPLSPDSADVAAGRLLIERVVELSSQGADFAIETTLSGNWLFGRIVEWQKLGYAVELHYITLSSADLAVERVRRRSAQGRHDVPEETIRRRFARSRERLGRYKNIVDHWIVYDNSGDTPVIVDEKSPKNRNSEVPFDSQAALRAFKRAVRKALAEHEDFLARGSKPTPRSLVRPGPPF